MSVFITQLIYIKPGSEVMFDEFESHAIPLINDYHGALRLRVRPPGSSIVSSAMGEPYEIHLVEFESEEWFENFLRDKRRNAFLHLKEASVRLSILYKGFKYG